MALSHGLTSRQTLILCCSLLLTIAGCGLLWHVHRNDADILEIIPVPVAPGVSITGTMGVGKRAYDYYIFGYLLLWVSHLAAAKALNNESPLLGLLHSFNVGILFMIMIGFTADQDIPTTLLQANKVRKQLNDADADADADTGILRQELAGLVLCFMGALFGILTVVPTPTVMDRRVLALGCVTLLLVFAGWSTIWSIEFPGNIPDRISQQYRNAYSQFIIQNGAIIYLLFLALVSKSRDLLQSSVLYLGVFGIFNISTLFLMQAKAELKLAGVFPIVEEDDRAKLWAGGLLSWFGMILAICTSVVFVRAETAPTYPDHYKVVPNERSQLVSADV